MRLAVVTGGSRGLGEALCAAYRARGWSVVEFSRSAPHPFSVRVDLSDPVEAEAVFGETFTSLAESDPDEVVVVSNAATLGPVGSVERAGLDEVSRHISLNVTAPILLMREFAQAFQDGRHPKTFVNISSGAANKGYAGWSLYCASKAATENFMRAVALEQERRAHPIRAISINPGVMDTGMQATVRASRPEDFPTLERFLRLKEDGGLAAPSVVAGAIVDLVGTLPHGGGVYKVAHHGEFVREETNEQS